MNLEPQIAPKSEDLLFASLDIPLPDTEKWKQTILSTPKDLWFFDDYRTVSILSLRTQSGGTTLEQTENRSSLNSFKWTPAAFPELIQYFESYVFPWSSENCRIAVLHTPPGGKSNTHIDCAPDKVGTIQHKFRIVLSGNTRTLYFETENERVWAPDIKKPFLMDGSWPHGLVNNPDEHKITICLGAPFTFSANYPTLGDFVSKEGLKRPNSNKDAFEKKYWAKY